MEIYTKGTVGEAWQYKGDIKSMPDWVKESSGHHIEVDENGVVQYWNGNEHMRVDNGDWFVMLCWGSAALLFNDYSFKYTFTFSDPADYKTGSVAFEKYRSKSRVVDAWQYTGDIKLTELPEWVFELITHNTLGYHLKTNSDEEVLRLRHEGVPIPVPIGDWVVHYSENLFAVISDDKFKESFEQIK